MCDWVISVYGFYGFMFILFMLKLRVYLGMLLEVMKFSLERIVFVIWNLEL